MTSKQNHGYSYGRRTAPVSSRMAEPGPLNVMLIGVMRIAFFAVVVALLGLWAFIVRRGE